jgi:sugar lactone lactonase YvrE
VQDTCGNLYELEYGGSIVEIPLGGTTGTTIYSGLGDGVIGLAIDSSNNLYAGARYSTNVEKIPSINCVPQPGEAALVASNMNTIAVYYFDPGILATDSAGDLFIAGYTCCGLLVEETAAGKPVVLLSSLPGQITSMIADSQNNLYFTVIGSGIVYELAYSSGAYASSPTELISSGLETALGLSFDKFGNLFVGDSGTGIIYEVPYNQSTGTIASASIYPVASGLNLANALSIPLNGTAVFFTGSKSSDIFELTLGSADAGSAAVGGTGSTAFGFYFNASTSLGSIAVSPAAGYFSNTKAGSCNTTSTYTAGSSCTVDVSFGPKVPGLATGSVVLANSSGAALATGYVSGVGLGAGLTVDTGTMTSVGGSGSFKSPMSVALDAAGDSYFADAGNNAVLEFKQGSTQAISLGSNLLKPSGVAVDGVGNVIIADTGNNQIVEVPIVNGALSNAAQVTIVTASTKNSSGTSIPTPIAGAVLSGPTGVTVDGQGNLYIADTGNNRIVYLPYNGSWNVANASVLGSDLTGPLATTVDPSGNLYVADSGTGQIYRLPAPVSSGVQQTVAVGYSKPSALATDASGSLFVVDQGDGNIVRIPNLSGTLTPNEAIEVGIGNANPYGLAVDPYGNLYVADSTAGAAYLITRTSTTEVFGDWPVGSPSGSLPVKVENEGNQVLTLASPFYTLTGNTGDFSLSASPSSACVDGGSIAVGAGCELDASFQPTASGNRSETLTLNSNATNAVPNATTVQVVLSGTGATTAATTTALAITSPAGSAPIFGHPITLTASVASSGGTPTGSAQLLADGVITGEATLSGSGVATFTLATGLTGGSHSLEAVYLGSSFFDGSSSSPFSVTVSTAFTTSTLAIAPPFNNPNSSLPGSSVTFTATINSAAVGIPTGTVTFATGSTSLGSASVVSAPGGVFQASISTTALPVGTDLVTATYSGDANYVTSSTSGTVAVVSAPYVVGAASGTVLISSNKTSDSSVTFTDSSYGGWQGVIGYQCVASSLPANSICVFSPGQLIVMASTAGSPNPPLTTTLTVLINNPPNSPAQGSMLWWLGSLTGLLLFWMRRRMMRGAWTTAIMLIGVVLFAVATSGVLACSNGVSYATPTGSSTITVVASADPYLSVSSGTTQPCVNSTTGATGPTQGPCTQQTFQIGLTVQ